MRRIGAFEVPVDLLVEFADGTTSKTTWSGSETIKTFTWPGQRVRMATLDPEHKLLLEHRRLDNTLYAPEIGQEDGLSRPMGDWAEALALALMGSLGP